MKPIIRTLNGESVENKIEDFLDRLLELHSLNSALEMRKFLDLDGTNKISDDENNFTNEQNNGNEIKYATVKSNDHVKKIIDVIRYVIAGDVFILWIDNVLRTWNRKIEKRRFDEIRILIEDYKFSEDCKSNRIVKFNIDKNVWDEFVLRCRRTDMTISDGFKYAIVDYVSMVSD